MLRAPLNSCPFRRHTFTECMRVDRHRRGGKSLLAFSKVCYKTHTILRFRELGNNPLLCLVLYKLLLNCFVNFEFPHFKRNCENWKRSVEEQRKCLMGCKIGHVGED